MASNEFMIKSDLSNAKRVVDMVLEKMGFQVTYSNLTEAVAERGSGLATMVAGPFAGKKNLAMKIKLTFQENGNVTNLFISDQTSGLQKTLTLTGGKSRKVMEDVMSELRSGLQMANII